MKSALLIGNTDYTDPRLAQLKAPAADVAALAELLRAPEIGGFDQVQPLLNRPFAEVQPAIEDVFADSQPDDLVLLYFSGHGVKDDRNQLYLALTETRSQKPRALSLSSSFLKDAMDCARARQQVLILDCCYSGAFAAGLKGAPGAPAITVETFGDETRSRGRVVLTATNTTQYALEGDQVPGEAAVNSLYTHYLIEALRTGAADEDGDGWLTPKDLHDYISRQVAPRQHPQLFALAQEADIRLARNPHPAALPADLVQALADPDRYRRTGAVLRLGDLLYGEDARLARAARRRLEELQADDTQLRYVSDAVAKALREEEGSRKKEEGRSGKEEGSRKKEEEAQRQRAAQKAAEISAAEETAARRKREEDERRQQEWRLKLAADVVLELARVPAGEFLMGSDKAKDKEADDDETPQHKLALPEYLIGKYPVTVAQFAAFVAATKHQTAAEKAGSGYTWTGREWKEVEGANWQHPAGPQSGVAQKQNHPVTLVSWEDAAAFCAWASQASGRAVRLPFEPEWEKAARGADGRLWPWGNTPPDAERCNFNNAVKDTTPVGKYSPAGDSPYGCADMAGNVWEWTGSFFKPYPYVAGDGREVPQGSDARVVRGGAFNNPRGDVRCACRCHRNPIFHYGSLGFRVCVRPISPNSGL